MGGAPFTTYVGSFPLPHSAENLCRVAKDVLRLGIDYPNYPQLRSFIDMFLTPLLGEGIEYVDGRYVLTSRHIGVGRVDPAIGEPMEVMLRCLDRSAVRGIRACVTGPFTLASHIYLSPSNVDLRNSALVLPDVVRGLARYTRDVARLFIDLGADYINIDEPVLGVIVGRRVLFGYDHNQIVDVLNGVLSGVNAMRGIHVRGRLKPYVFGLLSRLDVEILDHEFADNPENVQYVARVEGKRFAVGVVSSRRARVESPREAADTALRVAERAGMDAVFAVKPDCGFAALRAERGDPEEAYWVALEKLRVVREAAELLRRQAIK